MAALSPPNLGNISNELLRLDLPIILNIPPKLFPIITDFNSFRYFLLEGGRGSAKSHSVARFLLYLGEQRKVRIVCGREIQNNIEESVYTLLKDLIEEHKLAYDVFSKKIVHRTSGSEFRFKGFREQGSVSIKGLEGCDILWIDEAQSITKITLDTIKPTIRKEKAKVFFTMNRFVRDDAVYTEFVSDPQCKHIHIDYFDNPFCPLNLKIQAEDSMHKNIRDYNHIWLGHPLASADDFLFDFDKLQKSFDIVPFGETFIRQRILAIDFAAQGNDLCVATVLDRITNQHWKVVERIPWSESDTMVSVGKIINLIGQFKPTRTIIDIGGMGKPVYDRINEVLGQNNKTPIDAFDGGSTEGVDTKHYANKRALGYFTLKEWFSQLFLLLDRKDNDIVVELEKIRFKYRSNGVRVIQAKVDMKKDLGFSPDNADSLMMAVYCAVFYLGKSSNTSDSGSSALQRKSGSKRRK